MRENRERPVETFEEFGGFQQHDTVKGFYEGKSFSGGEIKSFTKYLDTGEVVANICATKNSVGFYNDIHVNPAALQLEFRMGKVKDNHFKLGKVTKPK